MVNIVANNPNRPLLSSKTKASDFSEAPDQTCWPVRLTALLLGSGFCVAGLGILAAEAFHASCRIHQLVLTREKRMAIGADFDGNVVLACRPRRKQIAARTMHARLVVLGMNSCLHSSSQPFYGISLSYRISTGRANRKQKGRVPVAALPPMSNGAHLSYPDLWPGERRSGAGSERYRLI